MSKNLFRKGLALATVLSFGLTGISALPASAATGDVTIAPSTGTGYTAFATDKFTVGASVASTLTTATKLAYRIENADSKNLVVTTVRAASLTAYADNGSSVRTVALSAATPTVINFTGATYAVVSGYSAATNTGETLGLALNETTSGVDRFDYLDGGATIKVQAWVETEATADFTTVDSATASAQETITFVDPSTVSVISAVEKIKAAAVREGVNATTVTTSRALLNGADQAGIAGSIKFSTAVNLDQVDLTKWQYALDSSYNTSDVSRVTIALRTDSTVLGAVTGTIERLNASGYSSSSSFGKIAFLGTVGEGETSDVLRVGKTYKFTFRHLDNTTAPINDFSSAAVEVIDNTADVDADDIAAVVTSSTDAIQTDNTDTSVQLRADTKAFTYKAQVRSTANVSRASANVPVAAVVTAGSFMPTGEELSVSGASKAITKAGGSVIVTGLSNSDGNWSVTVTSKTAKSTQSYVVDFYVLDSSGVWQNDYSYTATYETAAVTTFAADSTVLSGSSVTVGFDVTDQFGQAISLSGTKALSVELKATNKTNLEKYVPVTNGSAKFTFTNYVTTGGSDVLTAKLYTGTSSTPGTSDYVSGKTTTVNLYNTAAVAGVNVVTEKTGVIVTYDDFITGASNSTTNVAPNDNSFTYTGTVVDASGAGIPGAAVTISGKGFQFVKTGSTTGFAVDSISLAASDAGVFSVDVWTHVAAPTGNVITVKAGDKSATTKVKSDIQTTGLSAENLSFSWDAPARPVMNTTYAVTASVTDKWGNAIKGAKVRFNGYGSALFNGKDTDVDKTTAATGKATAYLRSVKDVYGISTLSATIVSVSTADAARSDVANLTSAFTDATGTKWDESLWSNTLEKSINFYKAAPKATITKGATSSAIVTNVSGATVKIVRGTKATTKVATSNKFKISLKGGSGTVKVYVDGVKIASK